MYLPLTCYEPVPSDQESCDSCQYETRHLHKVKGSDFTKQAGRVWWVCDLCYCTFASNALQYPEQYRDGGKGELMQHINHVANLILEEIRGKQ